MKRKIPLPSKLALYKMVLGMLGVIGIILLGALILSIFRSGYFYQFDIDEFFFAQRTFLFAHGSRPYLDVYTLTYPPLFEFIMRPIFTHYGFSFAGLYAARAAQIGLFIIRFTALFFFAKEIFNKKVATLFVIFALLDPMLVLTGMQYRPDNLMLTLFSLGLFFLSLAWKRKMNMLYLISGFCLSLSIIVLPKMVPSLGSVIGVMVIFLLVHRNFKGVVLFLTGLGIPIIGFLAYLLLSGEFQAAYEQTFVDTKLLISHFDYPIPIFSMHKPDNFWVFGVGGKPISWVYSWVLPGLGLAGLFQLIQRILDSKRFKDMDPLQIGLIIALPLQWSTLFVLQAVFLQYYMAVNWLLALFASFLVITLFEKLRKYGWFSTISIVLACAFLAFMMYRSTQFNTLRSTITSDSTIASYQKFWAEIPEDEAVFPGFLFRKQIFPVPYGSPLPNFPLEIYSKLPDIPTLLEKTKPRLMLDEYTMAHLPPMSQVYILAHYDRVPLDGYLMVRKE